MKSHYRPPKIYLQDQQRRHRDALAAAERAARDNRAKIDAAIEEHGERMSAEGKGLLMGLAEALKGIAAAISR